MDIFIARQPILTAAKQLFGYELLFRDSLKNVFPDIDGDTATCRLFSHSFSSIDAETLSGGRPMFINFTRDLLIKGIPKLFPKESLVVEILEDVAPDPDVVAACDRLASAGYTIALDDFLFRPELLPLIQLARIIKFDFRLTPMAEIVETLVRLSDFPLTFLAEKIETIEEFESAKELGFAYFQGYFFCKPEIVSGKDISPNKITLLQIMAEINREDSDMAKLTEIIQKDVSLTYKLLRFINSAFFRRRQEIQSVHHAMAMLGERETKTFFSVVAMAAVADEKPTELIRSSIIRARMCELIGHRHHPEIDRFEFFLTGMFSRIDAMLDHPIAEIIQDLPLTDRVKRALIAKEGVLAEVLSLVGHFESGAWSAFSDAATELDLDVSGMPDIYFESVNWADTCTAI